MSSIEEIEDLNRKLIKRFEGIMEQFQYLTKYSELFEDTMQLYRESYPIEYKDLILSLKGSLGYYNRVDFDSEASEILQNNPIFIRCLMAILVGRSSIPMEKFIKES